MSFQPYVFLTLRFSHLKSVGLIRKMSKTDLKIEKDYLTPLCLFRLLKQVAIYSYWEQGYRATRTFRLLKPVAIYSHWEKQYLTPLCLFILLKQVAIYSHWEQGYLTPLGVNSYYLSKLQYTRIENKDISLLCAYF